LPLLVVIASLIGSVVLPARQSLRILGLLRETTHGIAPAKVLTIGLQSGLVEELSAFHAHAEAPRRIVDANRLRLDSLEAIAARLDTGSASAIRDVGRDIRAWWQSTADGAAGGAVAPSREAVLTRHGAAMNAVAHLSARLALETRARDDRVERLERLSLLWNVLLVIAAFAALSAVIILAKREHRALEDATMRSRRETVLRETAEAMAAAFTLTGVMECITASARRLTGGRGAYIERIIHDATPTLSVCAVAGDGGPSVGSERRLAGSLTAAVVDAGVPLVVAVPELAADSAAETETALVIPLAGAERPLGALFVLGDRRHQFQSDDVAYAQVFGHLASLALEKVRVLHEAREGQQKLERVLASRSRLIRGFSHDVKNPVGAADGYAALLSDGIYGALSPIQTESIGRIRRSLRTALSLIHDLHELASAETGHLAVTRESVDVNAVVGGMVEEYQAAARAGGLSFEAVLDPGLPVVSTSGVRVQQVVSNLLSNAIKYTARGSVTIQTMVHDADPAGVPGEWIQVHVSDTGPGIPADKREIIFEEFTRIGPGDKSGAGLGLAISRLLAGALGGHLTVESTVGSGSRFTLWLPADQRLSP
jgi:signal transduction histidine kinase